MFANNFATRFRTVSMSLTITMGAIFIIPNAVSHAGPVKVEISTNRLAEVNVSVDKAIAAATAAMVDCPAPTKSDGVRGEIRNCAQGKNSAATVDVGNKTIVHGNNNEKR